MAIGDAGTFKGTYLKVIYFPSLMAAWMPFCRTDSLLCMSVNQKPELQKGINAQ
jgi:hypothetical protein